MTQQPKEGEAERVTEIGALEQRFAELMRRFWRPLRQIEGKVGNAESGSSETN